MIDKKQIITFIILFILLAVGLFAGVNWAKDSLNSGDTSQEGETYQNSGEQPPSQEQNTTESTDATSEDETNAEGNEPSISEEANQSTHSSNGEREEAPKGIPQTGTASNFMLLIILMIVVFYAVKYLDSKKYLKIVK